MNLVYFLPLLLVFFIPLASAQSTAVTPTLTELTGPSGLVTNSHTYQNGTIAIGFINIIDALEDKLFFVNIPGYLAGSSVFITDNTIPGSLNDPGTLAKLPSDPNGQNQYIFLSVDQISEIAFALNNFGQGKTRSNDLDFDATGSTVVDNTVWLIDRNGNAQKFKNNQTIVRPVDYTNFFRGSPNNNFISLSWAHGHFYAGTTSESKLYAFTAPNPNDPNLTHVNYNADLSLTLTSPHNALGMDYLNADKSLYYVDIPTKQIWKIESLHYLDAIDDLTASPASPTAILLSWTTPEAKPEIIGYEIRTTTIAGQDPDIILTANTGNQKTTALITNLSPDVQYYFTVYSLNQHGKSQPSNLAASFTSHDLELGNLDFTDTNTETYDLIFSHSVSGDSTIVNIKYEPNMVLACEYELRYAAIREPLIINPTLSAEKNNVNLVFQNAEEEVIYITCTDSVSEQTFRYVVPQTDFEILHQIEQFQDEQFGTSSFIGTLDIVTTMVIIFSMIGFNRVNETAGIITGVVIIAFAMFFGLITFPMYIIPILILIVMVAIISTKRP